MNALAPTRDPKVRLPKVRLPILVPMSMGDAVEAEAARLGISVAEAGRRALAMWLLAVAR